MEAKIIDPGTDALRVDHTCALTKYRPVFNSVLEIRSLPVFFKPTRREAVDRSRYPRLHPCGEQHVTRSRQGWERVRRAPVAVRGRRILPRRISNDLAVAAPS